ncbi:MAG: YIP1 family protein [Nitrososphaerota archaeon]
MNFLGIESTDLSSAYQAQILAYRILKYILLHRYEKFVYLIEVLLILLFLTFLHLVFKFMGGKGSILNAWKALCYGVGPCIIGGFLSYISLFAALYSFILHRTKNFISSQRIKSNNFLAIILALIFIKFSIKGTTTRF